MPEMDEDQLREAARAFGRLNAAKRRIVELTCAVCGTPIAGTLKRRYCSNRCAVRAFRQRQAAAERAGAIEASQSVKPPAEDSDTPA